MERGGWEEGVDGDGGYNYRFIVAAENVSL